MAVEDNYGGLKKIYLAKVSDLSALDLDPQSGAVSISQANFDGAFTEIQPSIESIDHQEQQQIDDNGDMWSQRISFSVPKLSPALLSLINVWRQKEIVVIIYDHHDQARLVGSVDEPLMMVAAKNQGRKVADLNSVQFELRGNTEFQAAFVTMV